MIDRRVRVLRMVATCGTVTGAAEALHYAPSAVSQQLRTLAKDLGVELVVQDGRRIRLTPAARVLLDQTESLYARWEEIRGLVALADDEGGGAVRLCGFSTAAAALLPRVAARLVATQPPWQVRVIEVEPKQCFELLLADQADVAVVVATAELPSADDPRFELNQLLVDPLDLLLPENHRLAHEPYVQLADLADEAWIMDRPGRPYHQLLQSACAAAGFTPVVAHHAAEWDTGSAMVAAGLGIVEETALVTALKEGWIKGAGVDVIEDEANEKSELFELDNVVITPHAAFISEDSFYDGRKRALKQLVMRLSEKVTPSSLVNKNVTIKF
jgi:DNA-binding transcriptional LysR family regulator